MAITFPLIENTELVLNKPSVSTVADLPSDSIRGDMRRVTDTGHYYIYSTIGWVPLSPDSRNLYKVVTELPVTGEENLIYIVPDTTSEENLAEQFVWLNNDWTSLGSFVPEVDLQNYYDKTQVYNKIEIDEMFEDISPFKSYTVGDSYNIGEIVLGADAKMYLVNTPFTATNWETDNQYLTPTSGDGSGIKTYGSEIQYKTNEVLLDVDTNTLYVVKNNYTSSNIDADIVSGNLAKVACDKSVIKAKEFIYHDGDSQTFDLQDSPITYILRCVANRQDEFLLCQYNPVSGSTITITSELEDNDVVRIEYIVSLEQTTSIINDYRSLTNKPLINSIVLDGNRSLSDLGASSINAEIFSTQYNPDSRTLTLNRRNMTPLAATINEVNGTQSGLATPAMVASIQDVQDAIDSFESGGLWRGTYGTYAELNATFPNLDVSSEGWVQNDYIVVAADESATTSIHEQGVPSRYIVQVLSATEKKLTFYKDEPRDPVQQATNDRLGVSKGSSEDGKTFSNVDGTWSVNGWDTVKTDINNLNGDIDSIITELDAKALKEDITSRWIEMDSYVESDLPSAYDTTHTTYFLGDVSDWPGSGLSGGVKVIIKTEFYDANVGSQEIITSWGSSYIKRREVMPGDDSWTPWKTSVYLEDLPSSVSNSNILHNWDFRTVINQRGLNQYTSGGYTIDRWRQDENMVTTVNTGYISVTNNDPEESAFRQPIERYISDNLAGTIVTMSSRVRNLSSVGARMVCFWGGGSFINVEIPANTTEWTVVSGTRLWQSPNDSPPEFEFILSSEAQIDIERCKMETGSVSTLMNTPPVDWATELLKCQRFYEKSYDINTAPGTITSVNAEVIYGTQVITGGSIFPTVNYKVRKRRVPDVKIYSVLDGSSGKVSGKVNDSGSEKIDVNITDITGANGANKLSFYFPNNSALYGYVYQWVADAEI